LSTWYKCSSTSNKSWPPEACPFLDWSATSAGKVGPRYTPTSAENFEFQLHSNWIHKENKSSNYLHFYSKVEAWVNPKTNVKRPIVCSIFRWSSAAPSKRVVNISNGNDTAYKNSFLLQHYT
jgi:hypothetical protein